MKLSLKTRCEMLNKFEHFGYLIRQTSVVRNLFSIKFFYTETENRIDI